MNETPLRRTVAIFIAAGLVTSARRADSRTRQPFLFRVHPTGNPDTGVRRTITNFHSLGLACSTFQERVGRFAHYRVELTSKGKRVFRSWGIRID